MIVDMLETLSKWGGAEAETRPGGLAVMQRRRTSRWRLREREHVGVLPFVG